jgi:hypothetical protein
MNGAVDRQIKAQTPLDGRERERDTSWILSALNQLKTSSIDFSPLSFMFILIEFMRVYFEKINFNKNSTTFLWREMSPVTKPAR